MQEREGFLAVWLDYKCLNDTFSIYLSSLRWDNRKTLRMHCCQIAIGPYKLCMCLPPLACLFYRPPSIPVDTLNHAFTYWCMSVLCNLTMSNHVLCNTANPFQSHCGSPSVVGLASVSSPIDLSSCQTITSLSNRYLILQSCSCLHVNILTHPPG